MPRPVSKRARRISLVVALAAGVLAVVGCSSHPRCPPGASCPAVAPGVAFTPTINGKTAVPGKDGHAPSYRVRPGENLVMRVVVTVPRRVRITALWFGISNGTVLGGRNGTVGINPILGHYRQLLSAGSHAFGLRWRIPARRLGSPLYLVTAWSSYPPPATVAQIIAKLTPSAPEVGGPVPPCTMTQLKIALTRTGGAVTGEVGGYLRFANAGHVTCQLHGWPKAIAVTASGQEITAARAVHGTMLGAWQHTSPLPVVRLVPGAAAYAVLAAGDHSADDSGPCPTVRLLRVTPPASSGHVTLSARLYDHVYLPACTSASGSTGIEVSAVVPLRDLAH
jgi:hypothetical protein